MEPLIDRLKKAGGSAPEARIAATVQWLAAWEKLEQIKKEYPFAVSTAYVQPGNRYLREYNPDFLKPEDVSDGLE
jgi:hypothetical protein